MNATRSIRYSRTSERYLYQVMFIADYKLGKVVEPTPELEFIVADFFKTITNAVLAWNDDTSRKILVNVVSLFWYGVRDSISSDEKRGVYDRMLKDAYMKSISEEDMFVIVRQIFEHADECGLRVNFNSPNGSFVNDLQRIDRVALTGQNYLSVQYYAQIVNSFIDAENKIEKWPQALRLLRVFWCAIRVNGNDNEMAVGDDMVFARNVNAHDVARYVLGKAGDFGILRKRSDYINYESSLIARVQTPGA